MANITVKNNELPIYDIILEQNYNSLCTAITRFNTANQKICIVSDTNVSKNYLDLVKNTIQDHCLKIETFVFSAGESSKNLDTVNSLYEFLIKAKFDRKDILIALGGGVVGDLTGYAAATYLRGIKFIQLPTSLLAMVDSSIGGKTGVDFHAYKNMIGAFHQPSLVYMNLATLPTLNNNQYYSGLGEIIKHGLIKDSNYFEWLKDNRELIKSRDISTLQEMIYRSCNIKREVVEEDPNELGDRALLNFGHTIGHAIEKLMNFELLHGECVAIGMVAASYISFKRGYISQEQLDDIVATLNFFELPISISDLNPNDIVDVTALDKKMESGKLKFILLSQIGSAFIDTNVTREDMLKAVQYIS